MASESELQRQVPPKEALECCCNSEGYSTFSCSIEYISHYVCVPSIMSAVGNGKEKLRENCVFLYSYTIQYDYKIRVVFPIKFEPLNAFS